MRKNNKRHHYITKVIYIYGDTCDVLKKYKKAPHYLPSPSINFSTDIPTIYNKKRPRKPY